MNYPVLCNEIKTDPLGLGYASQTDQGVADLLNASRIGQSCSRTTIGPHELWEAIDQGEMAALTSTQQVWLQILMSMAPIQTSAAHTQAFLASCFAPLSKTQTNITALATQTPCSRAAALLGWGTVVSADDVRCASGRG